MRAKLFLVTLIVAALTAPAGAAPFTVRDMLAMERISDPQVSPDGRQVVFVLRSTDLEANRGRTDLWIVGTDGEGLRRLTSHEEGDSNPRWAPDGRSLYFLSSRSGSSQVWQLELAGGEPRQVTDLPLDVGNLIVSPDGKRLAFSLAVFPDCANLECTAERVEKAEGPPSGQVYDEMFVRHWDTWEDGRNNHVFVYDLAEKTATDVMAGMVADCPSKPFGGGEELAFTPDGSGIVFSARDGGAGEPWSTNFDLYLAAADGSAAPRNLTENNKAWDTQPVFSPDGSKLAYLAMRTPGYESDRFRIVVRDWPEGTTRVLTEAWDRSPGGLAFSADGGTLYSAATDLGNVSLFAVDAGDGEVRRLLAEGHVGSPRPAGERILFALDHFRSPAELYTMRADGGDRRQITRINAARLEGTSFGEPEPFTFEGADGDTVHGWLIRPVGFDPQQKYPVALLIHGGPQGSYGNDFHYRWNRQTYAAAGYAMVTIDFHGSTGYGQEFTDSIREDWGGKPLVDLQKGLEAVLADNPWMDGERVCALGASYGGFMINWIAGQWPDRFRCLVNHDGVFDQRSMYFATEELWFPEHDFGGPYWKVPQSYERFNPARFVDRWQTPMLVIHGGLDHRVPLEQSLGAFTALQRRGVPSRFLYFPDENHWVLKPANTIQWHDTVLAWLDRWLREEGTEGSP